MILKKVLVCLLYTDLKDPQKIQALCLFIIISIKITSSYLKKNLFEWSEILFVEIINI